LYGGGVSSGATSDSIVVQCRFVKQMGLEEDGQAFVDVLEKGFEPLPV